ncbi:MAG: hypothetical protein ACKVTZ_02790 [Bacteroidia bacterium]
MIDKTEVLMTLQNMPAQFTIDELMEKLILIQKIHQGQEDIKNGKSYTTEEAKEKLKKWLK